MTEDQCRSGARDDWTPGKAFTLFSGVNAFRLGVGAFGKWRDALLGQTNNCLKTGPENPYQSPVDTSRGEWDHSLWWSFLRAIASICLLFLVIDAVAITRYIKVANPDRPIVTVVWGFFSDWKSGSAPTWPEKQAATQGELP